MFDEFLPPEPVGAKFDADKPRLGLVLLDFGNALNAVGRVGTFGAAKYSDHGWLHVDNGEERYTSAMLRHLFTNEAIDPQSHELHAAAVAWNALARLELMLRR